MSLLRRPPHRKTSPPCPKILFNVCLQQPRRVFEQKSETMLLFFFLICQTDLLNAFQICGSLCRVVYVYFHRKKWYFCVVLCWEKKSEGVLVVMCDDHWEDEEGIWSFFIMEYKRVDVSRR